MNHVSAPYLLSAVFVGLVHCGPSGSSELSDVVLTETQSFSGHHALVADVAFANDRQAVSGDTAGYVWSWNLGSGESTWQHQFADAAVNRIAVAPDRSAIAVVGRNLLATISLPDGETTREYPVPNGVTHNCVAYSPDGAFLAVGSSDAFLRVVHIATGEVLTLAGHEWPLLDVQFFGSARFLLAGDPQSVRLWDLETGEETARLVDTDDGSIPDMFWFSRLAFAPDGDHVIVGAGTEIILFHLPARAIVHRFVGHEEEVVQARLTGDMRYVVSASRDRSTRFWDTTDGSLAGMAIATDIGWTSAIDIAEGEEQFLMGIAEFDPGTGRIVPGLSLWNIDEELWR